MNIDFKDSPLKRVMSINDESITLECVCGKTFQQDINAVKVNSRCAPCATGNETIVPLTDKEILELSHYMFVNVLCEYPNKLVSL